MTISEIENELKKLEFRPRGDGGDWRVNTEGHFDPEQYSYRQAQDRYIDGKKAEVGARFWSMSYRVYVEVIEIRKYDMLCGWDDWKYVEDHVKSSSNPYTSLWRFDGKKYKEDWTVDLRAFKPIYLEGTELKVGETLYHKDVVGLSGSVKGFLDEFADVYLSNGNHYPYSEKEINEEFTRTAPKKTWWRVLIDGEKFVYGHYPHTNICRDGLIDSVKADSYEDAMGMPWPEEKESFIVRPIKREEVPPSINTKHYSHYHVFRMQKAFGDTEIEEWLKEKVLWHPLTDKALKDIEWLTFLVREYPNGRIEHIEAGEVK